MYDIVTAKYDADTGESIFKVNTRYGVFEHTVKVQPEDKDIANRWDGVCFAKMLCLIDIEKARARAYRERAIGIKQCMDAFPHKDSPAYKTMERQCNCMKREADYRKKCADSLKKDYPKLVSQVLGRKRAFREKMSNKQ